jgi:xylose dehydrogenase (NAD/NADP)
MSEDQWTDPVRWGVLGVGYLVTHATAAAIHSAQEAQLTVAAARGDAERARTIEPRRAVDSYNAVIEDPSIEAVYIALPNDLHLPWILAALEAGKDVLCEKPLTMSAEQARTAFDAAESNGRLLVEATWSRWHPRMQRIVTLATSGALGEITRFDGSFTFDAVLDGNYRLNAEQGGGALYDVGIYPLHALHACLLDATPTHIDVEREVNATGADLTTTVQLDLAGGTTASVLASFVTPEQQTLRVDGAELALWVDDGQAYTSWKQPSVLHVGDQVEHFPSVDAYSLMFSAVSRRVRGEDVWILPPETSIAVADLVDRISG